MRDWGERVAGQTVDATLSGRIEPPDAAGDLHADAALLETQAAPVDTPSDAVEIPRRCMLDSNLSSFSGGAEWGSSIKRGIFD